MQEILEIFAAMLAVWGGYSLIGTLRDALIYPKHVRQMVRGAVMLSDTDALAEAAAWAAALKKDGKISSERLIILMKDDIIEAEEAARPFGDVCRILYLKETECERSGNHA